MKLKEKEPIVMFLIAAAMGVFIIYFSLRWVGEPITASKYDIRDLFKAQWNALMWIYAGFFAVSLLNLVKKNNYISTKKLTVIYWGYRFLTRFNLIAMLFGAQISSGNNFLNYDAGIIRFLAGIKGVGIFDILVWILLVTLNKRTSRKNPESKIKILVGVMIFIHILSLFLGYFIATGIAGI